MNALPTGTVTFLFSDVEGSTQLVRTAGGARVVASEPPASHGYIEPGTAVAVEWAVDSGRRRTRSPR